MNPDEAPTVPPSQPPPARVAAETRYVLGDKLGEGAMGGVWAARDIALDRDVAFKVMHDEFLGADHQERLADEARAMARLSHPNVVAVYDVGQRDGRTFLTMELVRGSSLSAWLETPRTWPQIVDMFRGAAAGLAAAHAAGIVHRDVKPTNILVGDDGRARVADFGVAHAAAVRPGAGERVTTETAGMIGSPAYMAPEQLSGEPSDGRADQFGLCVSLYEALHGRRPFEAATIGGLIMAITRGPPPPRREVPAWLHDAVARGLAANPDRRFPSMTALAAALGGRRPRRSLALGIAAAVVFGGAGAIAFAATRGGDDPTGAPIIAATPTDAPPDAPRKLKAHRSGSGSELDSDRYLRFLSEGIKASTEGDPKGALAFLDQAIPLEHGPPNALAWAARISCELADEPRARAYLARIAKDTPKGRKGRLNVVVSCAGLGVDLRDAVAGEQLNLAPVAPVATTGSAKPPPPAKPPEKPREGVPLPPVGAGSAATMDRKARLERYRELRKLWQAARAANDYAGMRARALEAVTYADGDTDPYTVAIGASCQLGDKDTARALFLRIPATTVMGKNARVHVVPVCERLGIQLADLLYPEERKHVAP